MVAQAVGRGHSVRANWVRNLGRTRLLRIRKIAQFIMSGSIFFLPPMPEKRKTIWSELGSNPGPLASQVTALSTRPCPLGLAKKMMLLTQPIAN